MTEQGHAEHQAGGGGLHGAGGSQELKTSCPEPGALGFIYPPSPLPRAGPPPPGPPEKSVVCSANRQNPGQLPAQAGGPWEVRAPHLPRVWDFLLAGPSVSAAARIGFVYTRPTQASALPVSFLAWPHLASAVWGGGGGGRDRAVTPGPPCSQGLGASCDGVSRLLLVLARPGRWGGQPPWPPLWWGHGQLSVSTVRPGTFSIFESCLFFLLD